MRMVTSALKVGGLDLVVALHTAKDPEQEEWDRYVELLLQLKAKSGTATKIRQFIVTDGGAPNSKQRAQMHHGALDGKPSKLLVLTNTLNNPVKRGIVTAITWVNPAFMALPPEQWRQGLAHIDLDGHIAAVIEELDRLEQSFEPVKSLALLRADVAKAGVGSQAAR